MTTSTTVVERERREQAAEDGADSNATYGALQDTEAMWVEVESTVIMGAPSSSMGWFSRDVFRRVTHRSEPLPAFRHPPGFFLTGGAFAEGRSLSLLFVHAHDVGLPEDVALHRALESRPFAGVATPLQRRVESVELEEVPVLPRGRARPGVADLLP